MTVHKGSWIRSHTSNKRKIPEWILREMFTYFPFLKTSASNREKTEVAKW